MKYIVNFMLGLLFIVLFFGIVYLANQDMQAAAKLDSIDSRLIAAETRMDRAARALCVAEIGEGAKAVWAASGVLTCKRDVK
jgi:Flp pilus assembly protein TadG